jgi:alpha-glucosidase
MATMKRTPFLVLAAVLLVACGPAEEATIRSPDGAVTVDVETAGGPATYSVSYNGTELVEPSALGFDFASAPSLGDSVRIESVETTSHQSTWTPVWGATDSVENRYNRMDVTLREIGDPERTLEVTFRVYDDGVGFRYSFPEQETPADFEITDEHTEFAPAGDYTTWWQIANYNSYEYSWAKTPVSDLGNESIVPQHYGKGWSAFGEAVDGAANTPVTMRTDDGIHLSLHEADLTDYAGMTLENKGDRTLEAALVPWPDSGVKVKAKAPHESPWRTIQIGETAGDLIESRLIVNLNDPLALDSTDWVEPAKYTGVWWSLHLQEESWGGTGPDHGARTENVKRYIDLASDVDAGHVLVEGWNEGGPLFSYDGGELELIEPSSDFDLETLADYAGERDVSLMLYNETAGKVTPYRENFDEIFSTYNENNVGAVKAGHVGDRIGGKYHKHSQWAVNYYQELIDHTAEYEILLQMHEPIKRTGKRRTYPHYMTREGLAGMEQVKFRDIDPRPHTSVMPFTQMLAGPVDYMPGLFDPELPDHEEFQVQSTVARQLAYFPILLSGLQSVVDLPENYRTEDGDYKPGFEFLREVPAGWDETVAVQGEIGKYVTIARRSGDTWFVGSITNQDGRILDVPLRFLDDEEYEATIYSDGPDADPITNPTALAVDTSTVTAADTLTAQMVSGGGQAVKLSPAE